jgi:hypothetical protein
VHPAFPTPSFGRKIHALLGRKGVAGMRRRVHRCLNLNQLLVVPDKRAKASADPGPIATNVRGCAKAVEQRVSKQAIRRMGPRVRGDDIEWLGARGRHSHSHLRGATCLAEAQQAKAESDKSIQLPSLQNHAWLLRGPCHRARIRDPLARNGRLDAISPSLPCSAGTRPAHRTCSKTTRARSAAADGRTGQAPPRAPS